MSGETVKPKLSAGRVLLALVIALIVGTGTSFYSSYQMYVRLYDDRWDGSCQCAKEITKWIGPCVYPLTTQAAGVDRTGSTPSLSIDRPQGYPSWRRPLKAEECSKKALLSKAISSALAGLASAVLTLVLISSKLSLRKSN